MIVALIFKKYRDRVDRACLHLSERSVLDARAPSDARIRSAGN
jgi:hypothetical protein